MLPLSSVCDGTYSASSSPSGIVTVSVNNSTDELTIRGQSVGMATVRVRESGYKPDSVSFRVSHRRWSAPAAAVSECLPHRRSDTTKYTLTATGEEPSSQASERR